MDVRILRAILHSCEDAEKSIEKTEEYKDFLNTDAFVPRSDVVLRALSKSFSNLLCYKVSKEAYQRYSVRLHVIDTLRELCRITERFQSLHIFKDGETTSKFVENLMDKYLVDVLNECESSQTLTSLTSALMCLAKYNTRFIYYIEKIIVKISDLDSTNESEKLLCYAIHENAHFRFNLSTIERIYFSQRYKLIEEVLLNNFMSTCLNINTQQADKDGIEVTHSINELLEFTVISPSIFQLICAFLKELFVHLEYAPMVLTFIQATLKRIQAHCENNDKDIIDLYPKYLHSCIILLRIEPHYHTSNSKAYVLKRITELYEENSDDILILLLHFPEWLAFVSDNLINLII
ncbi:uncharacterized protein LOC124428186 [Vespa crabro]|uniref:uncharacterized protein LOC124428186 n=1 Tax=Vespa crabro TaxID=7445 RepID=UPI001F00950B|nr:uncharacterized protein LOC124428186 [Vespa crabro]XP_046827940.1 uncharacterized protein LOC124428186 [Vespa crabro]XP_046827949.1 uncharacterized protein LOC124428186 [Vespa crabro]XP_046827960.1 uncharacterized protein LOC124428186 [Vespa crabro]XP_046827971.1 uncharacterized protein LOC124428186 [Vespa crabro]XP_046827979.1 uncharacterized protein LOC124428186 [Vespa crabro]